jgi:tRNA modification GTPase
LLIGNDTIVAISSTVGPAARVIVRASGKCSIELARGVGVPADAPAGGAARHVLAFAGVKVPAWVYLFRTPHSYTGEDLVEFHLPGNPVLARLLTEELLCAGARPAEAGEFTARAYFNGRIDLTAAEGVAATIAATGERELAAARQLLAGELARRLAPVMDLLADTLALLEVGIDFVEEDVTFLSAGQVRERVDRADGMLARLLAESARFERLAHEPQVVLVGRPNAGKSTLLNALAGRERAVVSPVAGTTRDVLSAEVALRRGAIHVVDAAGLADEHPPAGDEIEHKMRSHALRAIESADVVVLVEDSTDRRPRFNPPRPPALVVRSKIDLAHDCRAFPSPGTPGEASGTTDCPRAGQGEGLRDEQACSNEAHRAVNPHPSPLPEYREREEAQANAGLADICVSARTGSGLEALRSRLDALCFGESAPVASLALNVRHVRAIEDARAALRRTLDQLPSAQPEFLALELREALDALGAVLGRVTPDELLGRIFAGFCIGK